MAIHDTAIVYVYYLRSPLRSAAHDPVVGAPTILTPVYKVEELQENVQNDVDVEKMIATNAARSIDVKVVNSSKCHSHAEWIG